MIKDKLVNFFFTKVDNSPLIVFRIAFGFLACCEGWGAIATGWVKRSFITPHYTFPFIDFMWLEPLPGYGMYIYFAIMGLAGLGIMLGYRYRVAIITFALMWSAVYLMQKTNYNNHYYLLMLLSIAMCFVPANRYYSLDVKYGFTAEKLTCQRWCIKLFAMSMSVVYFYAAVAKMYEGWLLVEPIDIWFDAKSHYYVIGPLLAQEWFKMTVAYGGIVFDLFLSVGLLWGRTRKYAFTLSVVFHLFNAAVFNVGIFPFLGIAFGVLYFEPEHVRRFFFKKKETSLPVSPSAIQRKKYSIQLYIILLLIGTHALLPLRHHLFPGDVLWTEEGHRLSWRMMLRVKTGYVHVNLIDNNTGEKVKINLLDYVTPKQKRLIATRPDMMWQFIQLLKEDMTEKGYSDISIFLDGKVKVNKSPYKTLYDPEYDMIDAKWERFSTSDWVLK